MKLTILSLLKSIDKKLDKLIELKTPVKTITLKELIGACGFNWVNDNINENNFPYQKPATNLEVLHFDKDISTENVLKEMEKNGQKPANLYDLLFWVKDNWDGKGFVVALGSKWQRSDGSWRWYSPYASGWGGKRRLRVDCREDGWGGGCRFLARK